MSGAADRNRTGDLLITNQLLYRLSYSSKEARILSKSPLIRKIEPGRAPSYSLP